MDFAMLPPEVNSSRMYSGAGAQPLLAAATAWSALAAELNGMGLAYDSMIDELSMRLGRAQRRRDGRRGGTVRPVDACHRGPGRTHRFGGQDGCRRLRRGVRDDRASPAVTANRTQMVSLLTTNYLGQNTAAIAATDAQYYEMWAQDATAMYGYATNSAAATRLAPFTQPPRTTNPAGAANQAGAVGQAAATATGSHADTAVAAITQALQGLSAPGSAAAMEPGLAASYLALASSLFGTFVIDSAGTFGVDAAGTFGIDLIGVGEIESELLPEMEMFEALEPVSAELGEAATLSGLSVPQSWATAAPTTTVIQQVGGALPTAAPGAVPTAAAGATALPLAAIGAAGLVGRATMRLRPGPPRQHQSETNPQTGAARHRQTA